MEKNFNFIDLNKEMSKKEYRMIKGMNLNEIEENVWRHLD